LVWPLNFSILREMQTVRRAVIDVGTNSVKLLVADVSGGQVAPVHEDSKQTRLGKGFYETHRLQPEPIARTAEAVWEFAEVAREKNAGRIRVIATSAARDAVNQRDLTDAIGRASGLKTEIISGACEADWAFQGVATDPHLAAHPLLLLDVGGGSTEFILGHGRKKSFAHSFPLGTVRLMEKFPPNDPPAHGDFSKGRDWVKNLFDTEVWPLLEPALLREKKSGAVRLVGTGGTTTILARIEHGLDRYDRDQIENTVLTLDRVRELRQKLWKLPLAQRKEIAGLPKSRADVILTGVLIYEAVMEDFGFNELRISTRGLRFAAVMNE
jgi:exopolyphosphatase / guanosine-5'-triphosphate,3'-diphosphate pyrophosphatase